MGGERKGTYIFHRFYLFLVEIVNFQHSFECSCFSLGFGIQIMVFTYGTICRGGEFFN